ncbi:MAG TPA: universal stress protein [Polyangia bacterium]|jgi:nucleotide-binding universal stress UspA family protein|nr:universal stress protein [Polyangia bacterium]
MKILCPTDLGSRALAAGFIAADLARRTSGSVELLHVVPAPAPSTVVAECGTALAAQRDQLRGTSADVTSQVIDGEIDPTILSRARAMKADLIVMAAHGRSAIERLILGSIAERTVRSADRPVLIVPPAVHAWTAADSGSLPLRVTVAHDGRKASAAAVAFTKKLRQHLACDVTIVRFYWPIEEYRRLGLTGPRDLFAPDPDVTSDLTRSLAHDVGVLPGVGATTLAVVPAWGDPAGRILQFAAEQKHDLVVMGTESRHGLHRLAHPPVSDRVARHASDVPILFVPPPPVSADAAVETPAIFTVLAATDLSADGNRAVPFAYAQLAAHGGVVELCHVHEHALPSPAYAYDHPDRQKLTDADRQRIEEQLRALVPSDADQLGITSHVTIVDGGHAAEAILQAAERLAVDALVLSSRGRGAASRAILGSVCQAVVRRSRRPVLIAPAPQEP